MPRLRSRPRLRAVPFIAAGGAVGATARHAVLTLTPADDTAAHLIAVAMINLVGSALLGALTVWASGPGRPWWLTPLLDIGVLGGFTTFSTVMADTRLTSVPVAAVSLAAQVLTCLLAAAGGHTAARRLAGSAA